MLGANFDGAHTQQKRQPNMPSQIPYMNILNAPFTKAQGSQSGQPDGADGRIDGMRCDKQANQPI